MPLKNVCWPVWAIVWSLYWKHYMQNAKSITAYASPEFGDTQTFDAFPVYYQYIGRLSFFLLQTYSYRLNAMKRCQSLLLHGRSISILLCRWQAHEFSRLVHTSAVIHLRAIDWQWFSAIVISRSLCQFRLVNYDFNLIRYLPITSTLISSSQFEWVFVDP